MARTKTRGKSAMARASRDEHRARNVRRPPPPPPQDAAWRQGAPPGAREEYHRARSPPRDYDHRDRELYSRDDDMYRFQGNRGMDNYRDDQRGRQSNGRYDDRRHADSYRPRSRSPPRQNYNDYESRRQDFGRPDDRSFRRDDGPHNRGFDFRFEAPPSISQGMRNVPTQPKSDRNGDRRDTRGRGARGGRGGRGTYQPYSRKAADRAFLKDNRAPTPELLPGMDEDAKITKYRDINDLSDSEEEEMIMSDDDMDEQPRKKQALDVVKPADGDSVPRWSNPDPYTALPPPDATDRKKKDVVKLIRKARVSTDGHAKTAVAEADDFISFNFDESDAEDGEASSADMNAANGTGQNSIQRPTPYSHKEAFHQTLPSTLPPKPTTLPPPPASSKKPEVSLESDPALGNRKRTFDDEIKGPPKYIKKNVTTTPVNGKLVKEWRPRENPTPWCIHDHSETENMGNWLHKEIVDFYDHVRPCEFEDAIRDELLDKLGASVSDRWPDAEIWPFGSYVAGLYLPTADMDVVFVSKRFMDGGFGLYDTTQHLKFFRAFLQRTKIAVPESVECIFKAKVPLVKYVDRLTGLRVDVSFENDTGIIANKTFKQWKSAYPAMPILVTLIKQFLTMRGLNEPVNGGIGGFSVICLVTSLLQHMPQVQSKNMIPEHHLGEVLMEFFNLYGNEFNTVTTGIQLNPPRYLPKNKIRQMVYKLQEKEPRFTIIDPNNDSNDIAGGARNTATIQKVFSDAYEALQKRMSEIEALPIAERRHQSLLGVILGGDYSSFDIQRSHLRHLHSLKR